MNLRLRFLACLFVVCVCTIGIVHAQMTGPITFRPRDPESALRRASTPHLSIVVADSTPAFYKRKAEWKSIIDQYWGAGLPTATKLEIFDYFWNMIDREYAGFPYLNVNWDSLKALYRPEVTAGVSRGRFDAIMGQMYLPLQEVHTYIGDSGLDSSYMQGGAFVYKPGVPMFWTNGWGPVGNFGAALTPLADSSLLVYRTIPSHPLGLAQGDIVLGYEGVPWKRLYRELLSAGLPLEWWYGPSGSTPRSMTHSLLNSAGNNWGLFDTIDVVKYTTGDTLHLPTAPLNGLNWFSLFAAEQVPVAGVRMPDYMNGETATWGIVQNTSIGYIYVYDWNNLAADLVARALDDLTNVKKVTGLILDCRLNLGTWQNPSDDWYSYLFSEIPGNSSQCLDALRSDPMNHFSFVFSGDRHPASFTPRSSPYDRPIAVLLGPAGRSNGDRTPFRLRFHPMVRSFGLPTNGAFVVWASVPYVEGAWGAWYYDHAMGQMESLVNNEGFLMHKSFPVDEEVWLTRDGVAKGEDDVVKRAIEWITTLTYAHDVALDRHYAHPGVDSVCITAVLANPLHHTATLSAIVTDTLGAVRDSTLFFDDGLHGDGQAGDSVWGCYVPSPATEDIYAVNVRADDITLGTFRKLPNATGFTTAGPLTIDSLGCTFLLSRYIQIKPYIRNNGSTYAIRGAKLVFTSRDPWVQTPATASLTLADIVPGGVATSRTGGATTVRYDSTTCPGHVNLVAEMSVGGRTYWTDTTRVYLPGVGVEEQEALPTTFALHQNYPNPFNPSTTIQYAVPSRSHVTLSVFNTLGQKVRTLVDEAVDAGCQSVEFDASGLASGVYLYRLQAGDFVSVKKLVVLK